MTPFLYPNLWLPLESLNGIWVHSISMRMNWVLSHSPGSSQVSKARVLIALALVSQGVGEGAKGVGFLSKLCINLKNKLKIHKMFMRPKQFFILISLLLYFLFCFCLSRLFSAHSLPVCFFSSACTIQFGTQMIIKTNLHKKIRWTRRKLDGEEQQQQQQQQQLEGEKEKTMRIMPQSGLDSKWVSQTFA